jgi:hypothetical protein
VAREIDGSARFRATQHAPRIGTMGGEDVPISPPHIRLETLISLDKRALNKSWPLYGVFILFTHTVSLLSSVSNLDPSQERIVIRPIHVINALISASPAFGCPKKK